MSERSTTVHVRRTWVLVVTAVFSLAGLPATAYGIASKTPGTWLLPVLYPFLLAGGIYAWRRWRRTRHGRVEATDEGLFLDGRLLVPRAHIRHAHVRRDRDGALVLHVARRDALVRAVDVAIATEEEGAALLTALRLDPARSRSEYEMTHGSLRRFVAIFGGAYATWIAIMAVAGYLLFPLGPNMPLSRLLEFYGVMAVCCAVIAAIYHRFTPKVHVSVGADGVRLRRNRRVTFHPYSSVASAKTTGTDVELTLKDGTAIAFHHQGGGKLGTLSDRERDAHALVARIEERLAAQRAEPGADTSTLARNGRDVRDWLREAATVKDSVASFRTNALPAEQLWRVVEDTTASATERAGAALALRHELDEGARARLRVAADACAAPHLRVALEHVADAADDDQLADALEQLGDESRTTPMRTMSK
ncbi:MAG: hypothetical protein KIT84_03315 [Labilithrix sp.]|nr:hypothetical protein [Labilithrix sp.]MCW5810012.1 hypothetical protein [Labilithrix sp.]